MTDSGPRRIVGSLRSALALIQRRARGRPRTATATANEEVPVPTLAELRHLLSEHDARTEQRVGHIIDGAPGEWLTAFETIREEDRRESQFVCLLTTEATVRALRRESWDFDFGDGAPGFAVGYGHGEQGVEYRTVNADGIIPLVYYRTFNGIFPHTVELAEDFRLFWGLYLNSAAGQWSMVDDSGDTVVVAEQTATALRIRREFVRRYQAARQLALDLQFNIIRHGGNELRSLADLDVEVDEGNCRISYSGGSEILNNDRYFTRCLGKRILAPPAIEHSGVWPFERARAAPEAARSAGCRGHGPEVPGSPPGSWSVSRTAASPRCLSAAITRPAACLPSRGAQRADAAKKRNRTKQPAPLSDDLHPAGSDPHWFPEAPASALRFSLRRRRSFRLPFRQQIEFP